MNVQLFSTFECNQYVEMAISTLEKNGILKENIFAVPLDNRTEDRNFFDRFTVQTASHLST